MSYLGFTANLKSLNVQFIILTHPVGETQAENTAEIAVMFNYTSGTGLVLSVTNLCNVAIIILINRFQIFYFFPPRKHDFMLLTLTLTM